MRSIVDTLSKILPKTAPLVAVAVSGGADSICLAHLLNTAYRGKVIALIVDHKLRDESTDEATIVAKRLLAFGMDAHILTWEGKKPKANISAIARKKRYELLTNYCQEHGIHHLFVAHNQNDQIETLLLRILRGSGIDGVCGMQEVSTRDRVQIIRPLLNTTRSEIEKYLHEHNIAYVNDPSNKNEKYDRVKVRNIMAQFPDILNARLLLLSENANRASSYLKEQTDAAMEQLFNKDTLSISLNLFCQLHEEIALRVLSNIIYLYGSSTQKPRLKSLINLYNHIKTGKTSTKTLGGLLFKFKKGVIFLQQEKLSPML